MDWRVQQTKKETAPTPKPVVETKQRRPIRQCNMIMMDRVSKRYEDDGLLALDNVSLSIAPREFAIVIGASGAGSNCSSKIQIHHWHQ